jgi:L-alanine-DL-glutamate epimerase-like enolase superfamily enzyme
MWNEMNPIGHKGFSIAALTAIDVACWDLIGKEANRPLHQLFGACRDEIPTYASGGLWLSMSIDECVNQAGDFVESGFHSMELLTDANQSLTVNHAIQLGRKLAQYDIGWFEEPVPYHDLKGHRELRQALDVAIATGETEYTRYGMRQIIEAEAADVLMPDLQRIGGYTEFHRSAALAASYDIPVSTHLFTEHSLCLAGSVSNCISVEHMPWVAPLFNEEMELRDGKLVIPQRPGTGFTFNIDAVSHFTVEGS